MDKMQFSVKATTEGMLTTVIAKDNLIDIDADAEMGGKGSATNPMETVLAALAACSNITARIVAQETNFQLDGISFNISAELDPRGVMGDPTITPHFEKIDIQTFLKTSEPQHRIKNLKSAVENRCPMYSLLIAAKVTLTDNWSKL